MEHCKTFGDGLDQPKNFKLINDIQDYIFETIRNEILKNIGLNQMIVPINIIITFNYYGLFQYILAQYGYSYLFTLIFWLSLL